VPLYLASLAPHRALLAWADVLLATWAYPDGCATALVARRLGKPCVVKVHGSDINVIAKKPVARALLARTLPHADAVITVSRPMGQALSALGVSPSRLHLVPNGIDASLFGESRDRRAARRALGLPEAARIILFVGRLEPQKGVLDLLEAFEHVQRVRGDAVLALVGDGVSRAEVEAARGRLRGRVIAPGARPHAEVAKWMVACDLVTLPSHSEGTPNVLLEGFASGRPAVATTVGGIPDLLADPRCGILVPPTDAPALAEALVRALERTWNEDDVRACGPWSWDESAAALAKLLDTVRAPAR
jgi:glycosyltransferase involved in cell wall biosynthesis